MAEKAYAVGSISHSGKSYHKTWVEIGTGPDQIDRASAERLIAMGYLVTGFKAEEAAAQHEAERSRTAKPQAQTQQAENLGPAQFPQSAPGSPQPLTSESIPPGAPIPNAPNPNPPNADEIAATIAAKLNQESQGGKITTATSK